MMPKQTGISMLEKAYGTRSILPHRSLLRDDNSLDNRALLVQFILSAIVALDIALHDSALGRIINELDLVDTVSAHSSEVSTLGSCAVTVVARRSGA